MSQTVSVGPYSAYQSPAMVGMKADSMEDNVDTFAANAPIPFGVVISRVSANSLKTAPGGTDVVGVAIHDHLIASRGGYLQFDAVSTLTRGRVWARLSAKTGVKDGVAACYDPATGMFAVSGTALLGAVFRSNGVDLPDVDEVVWGDGTLISSAVVELHHPFGKYSTPPGPASLDSGGDETVEETEQTEQVEQTEEERLERDRVRAEAH